MRDIRFRAWDKQNKRMLFFGLEGINGEEKTYTDEEIRESGYQWYGEMKNCELMQYTGFKNNKGTEIYEGDIFLIENYLRRNNICVASFCLGKFVLQMIDRNDRCYGFNGQSDIIWAAKEEVIGNIYENPELLQITKSQ